MSEPGAENMVEDHTDEPFSNEKTQVSLLHEPGEIRDDNSSISSAISDVSSNYLETERSCHSQSSFNDLDETEGLKNEIQRLKKQLAKARNDRDAVMTEMTELSGALYMESDKIIGKALKEKNETLMLLQKAEDDCSILKAKNDELKALLDKHSKKLAKKITGKLKKNQQRIDHKFDRLVIDVLFHHFQFETNELEYDMFTTFLRQDCAVESNFFKHIFQNDIIPCLTFANIELQQTARDSMAKLEIPTLYSETVLNK
ncbi:hypothetical protein RF11_13604 [Thelohanellus kitauei]|uniref:Uncharacterized protein n=1 Tax=Thelohanellus kitauei TaxID=669202 RepID=A0A0C2MPT9_THEKT|nr:hypothetical protein RF11_13604 [Thelohanellus kitauei]